LYIYGILCAFLSAYDLHLNLFADSDENQDQFLTDDYERMNIADALVSQTYADGDKIINQVMTTFYFPSFNLYT
jgi:hypothetical protein